MTRAVRVDEVVADHVRQPPPAVPGTRRPDEGGDPVCHLHRVCPECGYLDDDRSGTTCRRCGTTLPPEG